MWLLIDDIISLDVFISRRSWVERRGRPWFRIEIRVLSWMSEILLVRYNYIVFADNQDVSHIHTYTRKVSLLTCPRIQTYIAMKHLSLEISRHMTPIFLWLISDFVRHCNKLIPSPSGENKKNAYNAANRQHRQKWKSGHSVSHCKIQSINCRRELSRAEINAFAIFRRFLLPWKSRILFRFSLKEYSIFVF